MVFSRNSSLLLMGLVALASQNASAFTPAINNRVASSSMLQMSSTELSTTDRKLDAAIRAEVCSCVVAPALQNS